MQGYKKTNNKNATVVKEIKYTPGHRMLNSYSIKIKIQYLHQA